MTIVFQEVGKTTSWQVPRFEESYNKGCGWVEEAIQEGEGYLQGQKSYVNMPQNMKVFEGIFVDKARSTLKTNFLKYNVRKFVETIADIREIGTVGTDAPQYKKIAEIENNVLKCIYQESQFPRQLRKALQWATVTGVGYLWPKCRAIDYGFGERRIQFDALGMLDVVPVQVPASNDVQESYAVTMFEYMPIAEAHARFPLFQSLLVPVNQCTFPSRLSARRLDFAERFRYGDMVARNWGNLYCEIRYTFIRDMRINNTGYELPMGDAGTSWFYKVPSMGQQIFAGYQNGVATTKKASLQDCRVYPNLRLIITNPGISHPMYDGPAFDWHGKMPAVQYTVDDWPWEALGLSLVEGVFSIEQTKRKHERRMDQILTARSNPPMGYDRTATGGPKVENFDLFEENQRMGGDGRPKDTFQSLLPDEVQVTDTNYKFLDYLVHCEEQQLGINDLGNLMAAKMNLDADSVDKVLESVGPIAKGIAGNLESGNAKIADMAKVMIPQWMDTRRIIEYIGPDRITMQMLDYDPASLVPSHALDEYLHDGRPPFIVDNGVQLILQSRYDQMTRARSFARSLRLISVPSTLLKITQAQEQLKYLQLYRNDFPLSPHTVAKKLGIENFGDIPGDTEFEKWMNWKKIQLALAAQERQMAAQLGLVPPGGGGGEGGGGAEGAGGSGDNEPPPPGQSNVHAGGRPPSGKKPPHIVMKGKHDGNPRTTVAES